ncbi:MAG: Xaa-Pro peptidase family protein [Verrucomicrobiota bacterium]
MTVSLIEVAPDVVDPLSAKPDFRRRRESLIRAARSFTATAEVVLICNPKDIYYFTGVQEGISWLMVAETETVVVTRHLMEHEVREIAWDCEVLLPSRHSTERPDVELFVVFELKKRRLLHAVIEPAKIVASSYLALTLHASQADLDLHAVTGLTEELRAIKDAGEIALIRRCAEIASEAFLQLMSGGASRLVGKTERELATELERNMVSLGADRQGFPATGIIVASGPNAANAHHRPGLRRVSPGEGVLIDWGAELSGYRSDMTRTVFVESVPEYALEAYPVVEDALKAASKLLAVGELMGEIDRAAREHVILSGLPEFHYGVGHGVGLDIHEGPWLRAHSTDILASDMVTTIEPGIYLPGIGGIRIEDLFHVLPAGPVSLGTLPTHLDAMVIG